MARHETLRHGRSRQREGAHDSNVTNERLVDERDRTIPVDRLLAAELEETADLGPPAASRRPRTSASATAGLLTGVVALAASVTGVLAPLGLPLGLLGAVICLASFAAVRHPHVTGRGLAILGLLAAVTAGVIAVLAISGEFAWPNSGTNEVDRVHDWMNERWSWLERW